MTQATHTPGPWAVNASDCAMIGISRPLPDWPAGFHDKIADVLLTARPEENAANAHLIAAAPDMLAALEWLRDEYCEGGMFDGTEAEQRILSAIAKAVQS